jgi:hypothetical protein
MATRGSSSPIPSSVNRNSTVLLEDLSMPGHAKIRCTIALVILTGIASGIVCAEDAKVGNGGELERAVRKLYQAAWRELPTRVDAVISRKLKLPALSPAEARKMIEHAFDTTEDAKDREEEIQLNVKNMVQDRTTPRRMVQRIRFDGDRHRIDQVILPAGTPFGPNVRFSETFVDLGKHSTVEGYKSFQYTELGHLAMILSDTTKFGGAPVVEWITPSCTWTVLMMFGRSENRRVIADEAKLNEYIAKGGVASGARKIIVDADPSAAAKRDRVKFIMDIGSGTFLNQLLICDREDYARVFRHEFYDPMSGRLQTLKEVSEYDANGLPKQLRVEVYDENGKFREINEIVFLGVNTNPSFADDVFAFRPPPGYAVSDSRQQPPKMLVPAQEVPIDGGETISHALAEPAFVGMQPPDKKSSWEMSELLMATSRPAEVLESQRVSRPVSQPSSP